MDESSSNSPLILRGRTDWRYILKFASKFINVFNNMWRFHHDDQYLELLEDGILYFYRDLPTFDKLLTPLTVETRKKVHPLAKTLDLFFRSAVLPKRKFPINGFFVEISVVSVENGEPSDVFEILERYLKSLQPKNRLIFDKVQENTLKITVPDYETIQNYIDVLFNKYFSKKNIKIEPMST
jgi:hypothetical protein